MALMQARRRLLNSVDGQRKSNRATPSCSRTVDETICRPSDGRPWGHEPTRSPRERKSRRRACDREASSGGTSGTFG